MKKTFRVTSFILAVLGFGASTVSHADLLGDLLGKSARELRDKAKPSRQEPAAPAEKHRTAAQPAATGSDPAARFVQEGLRFSILAIDKERRSVTALDRTNGGMFRFTVNTATLNKLKPCERFDAELGGITVGQSFTADFPAAAGAPCCTLATPIGGAGQALGVREHNKHAGLDVILLSFKRMDTDIAQATWQHCNGSKDKVGGSSIRVDLGRTHLLDLVTKTKHGVVKDEAGRGLASSHHSSLGPYETVKTWAKFSAPQSDVVTVALPGVEPFAGVSLGDPTALVPPPR